MLALLIVVSFLISASAAWKFTSPQGIDTLECSPLTGRHRRILRAIANREKQAGSLSVVQISFKERKGDNPTILITPSGVVAAKTAEDLACVQSAFHPTEKSRTHLPTIYSSSSEIFSVDAVKSILQLINENELLQIRFKDGVEKKQQAKVFGQRIAEQVDCELVQVVGHSALIFRRQDNIDKNCVSSRRISQMLDEEFRRSMQSAGYENDIS